MTTTSTDGSYLLPDLLGGVYAVTVRMPGYLEAHREEVVVSAGAETMLPDLTLRAGDANADCTVNLLDLIVVASSLGNVGRNPRADINADGQVDVRDLILVSSNLGRSCPGQWGG